MNKYNVQITGNKKYIASSLEEAEKMAEKDILNIHYLWKTKVDSIEDTGKIGVDNER